MMGQQAVLEVGLEEEQEEPLMVEMLRVSLVEEEEMAMTAPAEVLPMAAVVGLKTVGMPVIQLMGVPVEHPGEAGRAGCRLTAERVTLRAAAEVVPLSMEMAPIPQGRWEPQGTMVTAPEIKTAVLLQIADRVTVGTVTALRL